MLYRAVLSRVDPEIAHDWTVAGLRVADTLGLPRLVERCCAPGVDLRSRVLGVTVPGPLVLAAGFDKAAVAVEPLAALGFGAIEVGTVTARAQAGNPKPRLFRLLRDGALINRMGFNGPGAQHVRQHLEAVRSRLRPEGQARPVVAVNVGKNRDVALSEAPTAYAEVARSLVSVADALVVNVSSPNTPRLRELQRPEPLRSILTAVLGAAGGVPVLLKVSPDETDAQLTEMAHLCIELGVSGMIAANTSTGRAGLHTSAEELSAAGEGGLSGAPLANRAREILVLLARETQGRLILVSSGGVSSAEDVWWRIRHGAHLVQAYTGFVLHGPLWPRRINRGVARLLRSSPYRTLEEARGTAL